MFSKPSLFSDLLAKPPSPYINRFLSADTIVPGYANPQSLNRYSYVTNNPLRYTDPTGHRSCEEYQGVCLSENQMTELWNNTTGNNNDEQGEDENGDIDIDLSLPDPDEVPCNGLITCDQTTAYEYATSYLPFTSSDACYFLTQDPILCDSSSWHHFPNVSIASDPLTVSITPIPTSSPLEEASRSCIKDPSCAIGVQKFVKSIFRLFTPGKDGLGAGPIYDWVPPANEPGLCSGRKCR